MGAGRDLLDANVKAWNERIFEEWAGNFSDDATLVGPGGLSGSGPEMKKMFWGIWQDAFPDNHLGDVRLAEDGDAAFLEAVFEGTHTAPMDAPTGEIPATGKRVSIPFVVAFTVTGGRFSGFRLYFDQMDLITQLGLA